jgi:catecholate siderophore receptor
MYHAKAFLCKSEQRRLRRRLKRGILSGSGRWIAITTLLAYATTSHGSQQQVAAVDQRSKEVVTTSGIHQRRFNIPASSLDVALAAWEDTTGRKVVIQVSNTALAGFRSQGAHGILSDEDALRQVLAGTGLESNVSADSSFVISVAHNREQVEVNAGGLPEIQLDRYPVPLLDTPQAITVVSQQTLQEQGSTTLRDALRNAPGISLAAGEGGSQGDNLTIRGFTARNDIFLDGMRDFGSYYRDPFNYEQIEVLEGPSSVTFGRGSTGGVINQETKQPELHRFARLELDGGTDLTRRLTADINEPLAFVGTGASFRLNLMAHESNVAERDVTENRRYGVAPSLAFGLGTASRLNIDYFRFQENDIPDYGIPWYFNKPAPVARHNYYGFQHGNFLRTDVNMVTVKAEHDFTAWATLRNQARFANNERDVQITEPQLNNATAGLITPTTPLSQINVNRNQLISYSNEGLLWDQLDMTVHTKFWGVNHAAVIGAEGGRETSDPKRPTYNVVNLAGKTVNTVPTANLLSPNEDQVFSGQRAPSTDVHVTSTSYGFYLLDTMQFGRYWEFTGGARFDRFYADEKSISYPTPKQTESGGTTQGPPTITYPNQLVRKPSWRAALMFKPAPNGSIYFGYGTSFNPSAEALALTVGPSGTGTANLSPEFNRSYELGTKWDLNQGRLSVRADIFRTTKDNARESSPTNSLLYVLAGTQRVDGAEAVVIGRITPQWKVLSSYTYMHSEVVNSQFYPAAVGFKLANVPDNLFNFWTTYQPRPKLVLGAGSNFVDSRTASSTVPLDPTTGLIKQVPSYLIFSAMSSYSLGEHASLQANVFNLTNRNYIDQIHPAHLVPGAGTSGLFGLNFKF